MRYLNWFLLVLGVWIFVSPWILGFSEINVALWDNILAGALVSIISLWKLFAPHE